MRTASGNKHPGGFVILAFFFRRLIAAKSNEAKRWLGASDRIRPDGIERVQLGVKRVAAVFGGEDLISIGVGYVVEGIVRLVAKGEDGDDAALTVGVEVDAEQRAPCSALRELGDLAGLSVGVTGGREEERLEVRTWQEGTVFRSLEGSG